MPRLQFSRLDDDEITAPGINKSNSINASLVDSVDCICQPHQSSSGGMHFDKIWNWFAVKFYC